MAEKQNGSDWLNDLAAVTAQHEKTPNVSHGELARTLNLHRPYVSQLLVLDLIFDPATLTKVRQTAPSFSLSFSSAKELLRLKGKVEDFPMAGREVLDQILANHLATAQIKALVDQIRGVKHTKGTTDTPVVEASGHASGLAPGTFERLGQRIGKAMDGFFGGTSDQPEAVAEPPGNHSSVKDEPKEAEPPKTATKARPVKLWEVPFKVVGWLFKWFLLKPGKWLETKILKRVNEFLDHPGTFVKNLVVGTVQFIIWAVLLCVLVWALRWGWDHYGRAFVSEKVTWSFKDLFASSANAPQTQANPTPVAVSTPQKKSHPSNVYREIKPPEELNDRVHGDKEFGTDFVKHQFELANQDLNYVTEFFNSRLSDNYSDNFYKEYFSREKQKEFRDQKEFQSFEPDNPPKLVRFDDYADDILVQGELTTRSDANPDYHHKVLSRERVGLILTVSHSEGDSFVSGIKEVKPEPKQKVAE